MRLEKPDRIRSAENGCEVVWLVDILEENSQVGLAAIQGTAKSAESLGGHWRSPWGVESIVARAGTETGERDESREGEHFARSRWIAVPKRAEIRTESIVDYRERDRSPGLRLLLVSLSNVHLAFDASPSFRCP